MTIRILMIIAVCIVGAAHAQQYKIKVHVLGHEGKPMQATHATLTQHKIEGPIKISPSRVSDNGYEFLLDTPGMYFMRLTGTHHRAVNAPILVEGDSLVELEKSDHEMLQQILTL